MLNVLKNSIFDRKQVICSDFRPFLPVLTRGVEICAYGAQGARGLKRDFRAKTPFYWVKIDLEEKIDAIGEKFDEN